MAEEDELREEIARLRELRVRDRERGGPLTRGHVVVALVLQALLVVEILVAIVAGMTGEVQYLVPDVAVVAGLPR